MIKKILNKLVSSVIINNTKNYRRTRRILLRVRTYYINCAPKVGHLRCSRCRSSLETERRLKTPGRKNVSAVRAPGTVSVCLCVYVRVCNTRGGGGGGGGKSSGGGVLCRRRGATEEIRGQDVLESRTCRRPCRERVPDAELRPFLRPYAIGVGFSLLGTDRAPRYTAALRRARRFPYVLISAPASAPSALSFLLLSLRPHTVRRHPSHPSRRPRHEGVFPPRSFRAYSYFRLFPSRAPFFPNRVRTTALPHRRSVAFFVSFHIVFAPDNTKPYHTIIYTAVIKSG